MLPHPVVARDPTTHAVADHDHVTPHGLAKNKVVKRRHAIHVRGRHAEMSGEVTNALIGDPAAVPLHNLERVNTNRFTVWITRRLRVNFVDFISSQHRSIPHRSTSARTK